MNTPTSLLAAVAVLSSLSLCGTSYYLDAEHGNDKAGGTSPETAWQSLQAAHPSRFKAGDKVLFKRGSLFRGGTLQLASGTAENPVYYGTYGEGVKPILQTSWDFNHADAWREISPDLWQNIPSSGFRPISDTPPIDLRSSQWVLYSENSSEITCSRKTVDGGNVYSLHCVKAGKTSTNIQFLGPDILDSTISYRFKVRVRASKPFTLPNFQIMMKGNPWTHSNDTSLPSPITVTGEWQELEILLLRTANTGLAEVRLNSFMGAQLPEGSVFEIMPLSLQAVEEVGYPMLAQDVGNVIFNHGEYCGWKRWKIEDLKDERDYVHDPKTHLLTMRHKGNPGGGKYHSLEFARKVAGVSHGNVHDAIVDGLWIRYTGAHGFGGMGAKRITIRNCDISYIGGSVLSINSKGQSTRYGNGVEFWCSGEDCLVENNRIWQVYDVAITNQGNSPNRVQRNLIYRNNLIFQCEQAYEYWRSPESSLTENIQFVNNTCLLAGEVWSHWQRPNKHSCHLLGYGVTAKTRNMIIQNNVFYNALESLLLHHSDWRYAMDIDNNLWWQDDPERNAIRIYDAKLIIPAKNFSEWQTVHKKDIHSLYAKPIFVRPDFAHPEQGDFRLAPDSPGYGRMGIK